MIADLTCDSDGKIDTYVENEGPRPASLPLHELRPGERYRIGFFLVGAYQEILGDIHNLFGDTDAIEVRTDGDGCAHRSAAPRRHHRRDAGLRGLHSHKLNNGWPSPPTIADNGSILAINWPSVATVDYFFPILPEEQDQPGFRKTRHKFFDQPDTRRSRQPPVWE